MVLDHPREASEASPRVDVEVDHVLFLWGAHLRDQVKQKPGGKLQHSPKEEITKGMESLSREWLCENVRDLPFCI